MFGGGQENYSAELGSNLESLTSDASTLTTRLPHSLSHLLLNTSCPVLANSVDPDQLVSEEAN